LSAVVFELFMFACASVIGDLAGIFGQKDAGTKFLKEVLPYTLLMGLAGAAAGGIGDAVGSAAKMNALPGVKPEVAPGESAEPDVPGKQRGRDSIPEE
jgi:hypothetical protein